MINVVVVLVVYVLLVIIPVSATVVVYTVNVYRLHVVIVGNEGEGENSYESHQMVSSHNRTVCIDKQAEQPDEMQMITLIAKLTDLKYELLMV
jgi:hypothetical protein